MSINDWPGAFLLTQLIEAPIYLLFARSLPALQRMAYAFGASTITHPIIWFCLPWETQPYAMLLFLAEGFAVGIEGLWGRCWHVPSPGRASLLANAASLTAGMIIRGVA